MKPDTLKLLAADVAYVVRESTKRGLAPFEERLAAIEKDLEALAADVRRLIELLDSTDVGSIESLRQDMKRLEKLLESKSIVAIQHRNDRHAEHLQRLETKVTYLERRAGVSK